MKYTIEYKDNISIDEIKTGEVIRTETGTYYLVIKLPRSSPRFIAIDITKASKSIPVKITEVFSTNGKARILPTSKEGSK